MRHQHQDQVSLEIARRIASALADHPEWLNLARENLNRWSSANADTPSLLRCYSEWRTLLARPIPEIREILTAPTDEGQRLRQNSPFVGVLPPAEIWDIKQRIRDEKIPA